MAKVCAPFRKSSLVVSFRDLQSNVQTNLYPHHFIDEKNLFIIDRWLYILRIKQPLIKVYVISTIFKSCRVCKMFTAFFAVRKEKLLICFGHVLMTDFHGYPLKSPTAKLSLQYFEREKGNVTFGKTIIFCGLKYRMSWFDAWTYGANYSRVDQVKFAEDQLLLGLLLNTLPHLI